MFFNHRDKLIQEHRDEWTPIYHACKLQEVGVSLEDFLDAPWQHLVEQGQESVFIAQKAGYRPLLPRQAAVARQVRALDLRSSLRIVN